MSFAQAYQSGVQYSAMIHSRFCCLQCCSIPSTRSLVSKQQVIPKIGTEEGTDTVTAECRGQCAKAQRWCDCLDPDEVRASRRDIGIKLGPTKSFFNLPVGSELGDRISQPRLRYFQRVWGERSRKLLASLSMSSQGSGSRLKIVCAEITPLFCLLHYMVNVTGYCLIE